MSGETYIERIEDVNNSQKLRLAVSSAIAGGLSLSQLVSDSNAYYLKPVRETYIERIGRTEDVNNSQKLRVAVSSAIAGGLSLSQLVSDSNAYYLKPVRETYIGCFLV